MGEHLRHAGPCSTGPGGCRPDDWVSVPAEKIAALREATESQARAREVGTSHAADWALTKAARAVVDAVETEDEHDALRERLCALADEWDATVLVLGGTNRKPVPRWFSQRLRELLGDA